MARVAGGFTVLLFVTKTVAGVIVVVLVMRACGGEKVEIAVEVTATGVSVLTKV